MAYLITHFWPGGTEEQYEATVAAVHPADGLPDGQLHHVAGPTDGGMLISTVWESKDKADRFVSETLIASMPIAGGFEGQPEERAAEITSLVTA
jgi:selenophosphate synthase